MKHITKITRLVLACVLVVGLLPASAFAEIAKQVPVLADNQSHAQVENSSSTQAETSTSAQTAQSNTQPPSEQVAQSDAQPTNTLSENLVQVYRLYNPISSEHLWTTSSEEYQVLPSYNWNQENVGWRCPTKSDAGVYRLYNPGLGTHHYTSNKGEADELVAIHGWNYDNEGQAIFYSAPQSEANAKPVYRMYNAGLSQHHYTLDKGEYDILCANYGWSAEGIDFYAYEPETAEDSPYSKDTDGDGIPDYVEINFSKTNPYVYDAPGSGTMTQGVVYAQGAKVIQGSTDDGADDDANTSNLVAVVEDEGNNLTSQTDDIITASFRNAPDGVSVGSVVVIPACKACTNGTSLVVDKITTQNNLVTLQGHRPALSQVVDYAAYTGDIKADTENIEYFNGAHDAGGASTSSSTNAGASTSSTTNVNAGASASSTTNSTSNTSNAENALSDFDMTRTFGIEINFANGEYKTANGTTITGSGSITGEVTVETSGKLKEEIISSYNQNGKTGTNVRCATVELGCSLGVDVKGTIECGASIPLAKIPCDPASRVGSIIDTGAFIIVSLETNIDGTVGVNVGVEGNITASSIEENNSISLEKSADASFYAEGSTSAGLQIAPTVRILGVDILSAGAQVGLKAEAKLAIHSDSLRCTSVSAYLYANISAYANLGFAEVNYDKEILNGDNSPIQESWHYENSKQVANCTWKADVASLTKQLNDEGYDTVVQGTLKRHVDNTEYGTIINYYVKLDSPASVTGWSYGVMGIATRETAIVMLCDASGARSWSGYDKDMEIMKGHKVLVGMKAMTENTTSGGIWFSSDVPCSASSHTYAQCDLMNDASAASAIAISGGQKTIDLG